MDRETKLTLATWRALDALKSAFAAKKGSFDPTCWRSVTLSPSADLADQPTIERLKALCAAAHEQRRAPRIKGARETSWADVYTSLCRKIMAHMLADGAPLLSKHVNYGKKTVYTWNVARIVLLRRHIDAIQGAAAAGSDFTYTGIDGAIFHECGTNGGETDSRRCTQALVASIDLRKACGRAI